MERNELMHTMSVQERREVNGGSIKTPSLMQIIYDALRECLFLWCNIYDLNCGNMKNLTIEEMKQTKGGLIIAPFVFVMGLIENVVGKTADC